MDNQTPIGDIPSLKKLRDELKTFTAFKRAMPFLGPLLQMLGVDVMAVNAALKKLDALSPEIKEFSRVPDEFNELFVERGWIFYERINSSVARSAIERAKSGDIDGAEADLVASLDAEAVRFGLMSMNAVHAFRPRMGLAEKALIDYREGRYHACVPVVLALLDGMVNEVHQKARGTRRGISAEGVDLTAWDSLAGHESGLNQLLKVVQKGRRRTTTEELTVPYRNGIMHGIDLGYDNVMVAAKTWALLFAAREWAIKAERGELQAPAAQPAPTLKESWAQLVESVKRAQALKEETERLNRWSPRSLVIGRDVPLTGTPENYPIETPERALAEYLCWWKQKNYGFMARQVVRSGNAAESNGAARVRDEFKNKRLIDFTFKTISDVAPAVTEIEAELVMEIDGETVRRDKAFRVVFAGSDGLPAVAEPGEWAVYTWAL